MNDFLTDVHALHLTELLTTAAADARPRCLFRRDTPIHVHPMFCIDTSSAKTIRREYTKNGEQSDRVQTVLAFLGLTDNENA